MLPWGLPISLTAVCLASYTKFYALSFLFFWLATWGELSLAISCSSFFTCVISEWIYTSMINILILHPSRMSTTSFTETTRRWSQSEWATLVEWKMSSPIQEKVFQVASASAVSPSKVRRRTSCVRSCCTLAAQRWENVGRDGITQRAGTVKLSLMYILEFEMAVGK